MARPSLLDTDPGCVERIADRVRRGNHAIVATMAEGVTERTFYNWVDKGEQEVEPYATFLQAITRARALAEVDIVEQLRNLPTDENGRADPAQARALQELLKRGYQERWGDRIEVSQKVDDAFRGKLDRIRQVVGESLYPAVLRAIIEEGSG